MKTPQNSFVNPPELLIATSNLNKLAGFQSIFAAGTIPIVLPTDLGAEVPEVDETGATLQENARLKATAWATTTGRWTLADDTGLEVEALGGRPGVFSARFAGPKATARENREKLLEEMLRIDPKSRAARFVCALAIANPSGQIVQEAAGICEGEILNDSGGSAGFGYDSLFYVHQAGKTLAQMTAKETITFSHRSRAVSNLLALLARGDVNSDDATL